MSSSANRPLNAPLNRLAGESLPNTLGGIGTPGAAGPVRWPAAMIAAVVGASLAGLAFVLLAWRPA